MPFVGSSRFVLDEVVWKWIDFSLVEEKLISTQNRALICIWSRIMCFWHSGRGKGSFVREIITYYWYSSKSQIDSDFFSTMIGAAFFFSSQLFFIQVAYLVKTELFCTNKSQVYRFHKWDGILNTQPLLFNAYPFLINSKFSKNIFCLMICVRIGAGRLIIIDNYI